MVREFAQSEIAPHVMEWDEAQIFPREISRKLGELGLMGIIFPEAYGGAGLGYLEYVNVIDELSRVDGSVGHLRRRAQQPLHEPHLHVRDRGAEAEAGSSRSRRGSCSAPGGSRRPGRERRAGTQTTAVRDGDGWVLNGTKNFITHGSVGDVAVLMAVTDRTARQRTASRPSSSTCTSKGIQAGKKENKLGLRASDTATLVMEDCRIPKAKPARGRGRGFQAGDEDPRRRAHLHRRARARDGAGRVRVRARLREGAASSSASRSPSSRRSSGSSPTWRPRSTPRAS